ASAFDEPDSKIRYPSVAVEVRYSTMAKNSRTDVTPRFSHSRARHSRHHARGCALRTGRPDVQHQAAGRSTPLGDSHPGRACVHVTTPCRTHPLDTGWRFLFAIVPV